MNRFCPNYKIKEVFDSFNEMVKALGGKPMTEEEFRSSALRLLRTGDDYAAVDAAYKIYNDNNGNFLDFAPNGEKSVLFQEILNRVGNREEAIRIKANIFSEKFKKNFGDWVENANTSDVNEKELQSIKDKAIGNGTFMKAPNGKPTNLTERQWLQVRTKAFKDWFGDWINDPTNASKVVDENGEPLVVYHGTDAEFSVFDNSKNDYSYKGFYFTDSKDMAGSYKGDVLMPVFLNIKDFYNVDAHGKSWNNISTSIAGTNSDSTLEWLKNIVKQNSLELERAKRGHYDDFFGKYIKDEDNIKKVQDFLNKLGVTKLYNEYQNILKSEPSSVIGKIKKFIKLKSIEHRAEKLFRNDYHRYEETNFVHTRDLETVFSDRDGIIIKDVIDYGSRVENPIPNDVYIVYGPNQIKSATDNSGEFSTENDDITDATTDVNGEPTVYALLSEEQREKELQTNSSDGLGLKHKFSFASPLSSFGAKNGELLLGGKTVSTKDILKHMYDSKAFSPVNVFLGQVLSNHDVPVRFQHLHIGTLMTTVSDENGGSVILIDPEKIEDVSNEYLADKLLHETVHAITVGAINNPKTEEEKRFLQINSKIFLLFDKLYPKDRFSRVDPLFYILTNEKEFAAEFATNEDARKVLFAKALEVDNRKTCLNILKNFINSLSKLLINRNIFSTTEEKLNAYQNELQRYLIKKRPIIQGNISNKDLFKLAYQNISEQTAFADDMATLKEQWSRLIDSFETNNVLDFSVNSLNPRRGRLSTEEEARSDLKKLSLSVADMLRKRLAATRVSNLKEEIKTKNIQILQSQIQQFSSDTVSDFLAISNFLSQVSPQLLEDSKKIRRIRDKNLSTTDSDYMYYNHDYFAVYEKILGSIQSRLGEPSIKNEILRLMLNEPNLKNPVVNDVQAMIDLAKKTANLAGDSVKIMKQILINNIKQRIAGQINLTHDPTLIEYVEELELIGYDTSSLLRNMGSADMAKDPGLRMLYNIVSGANRKAERDALSVQEDLNLLLSKLGDGESVMDLYELDENKQTTLYLVRDLNFGRFFKDYKKFLEDLNMLLGIERLDNREAPDDESEVKVDAKSYMSTLDKLGVNYDKSELKIVDGDVLITKKEYFNFKKNLWLSEHCERKYKTSYYFAFNNLSPETREARDIIQGLIRNIKSRCLGKDGYYHYEKLTDEEWKTLNQLYIQKRLLASDHDINGDLKTPGTVPYKIAKALQHLNEVLYKKEHKLQKDWDQWNKARNNVIRKAGGVEEMKKGRSDDSNFDWKMLDEWDARNSKQQFKEDSEGNALLFKRIEEETAQIPIYEVDNDGGARYEEITKEISELLSVYRNYNTGDIETLPKNIQVKLKKLIDEQEKIKRQAKRQSKQVKLASKQRAKVFAKYATYEYTETYRKMLNHARAMDIDVPGYLDSFRKKTGKYKLVDDDEVVFRPYKWYTKIVVKPEYQEEFMELVPGDGWINTDDNDELLNDKFDNSYNMSYVPKRDLYDNSAAYKKIQQSESLRALYDKILEVMRKSNEMLTNRMRHDDYLLPAIEGSMYKYAKNKGSFSGRTKAAWEWFKDNTGATASFDIDYGASVENILNGLDDLGEIQNEKVFDTGTIGTRPDGRQLNLVITPYTTKLLDPSKLSADLIGIVGQYYLMSSKFKYKTEVKDLAESLVDMMEYRSYTLDTRKAKDFFQKKRHVIDGVRSNTYKMARTFLDMNLYDIKTTTAEWHGINLGKLAALYKAFVTAVNLGCNIAVAGTGALTAWYSHLILAITGQHYSLHVAHLAGLEVSLRLLRNYGGVKYIGDLTTNDKLMILAEEFNIANQQEKKRSNTNRNRIVESVNRNKTFGMLSASDFIIKSQIMVSTLMSYRLVDGHFTTIEDIKMNGWNKPEEWVKEQTKKWNKGVCLYSVLDAKNHKFYVDPKYAKLYKEVEDIVHARIQKYAENADGMATPEQKALITQGFVGSCVLIHRQYLPLMINERFGHIVFDLDILEYKNGDFRTIGNFVKGLLFFIASKNNRDAFKDMFFYDKVHKQELIGSLDVSEMLKAQTSMVRRYQLKKVASELLLYNLVISPFVTYMISLSREDDKKDDLLFLLVTFILTRFMWESYTPYRMDDMINNIKSPSAATSVSDKAEALAHSLYRTVFPRQTLWDTFFSGEEANKLVYDIYVKRGVYKKMPFPLNTKAGRDMFKLFIPAHNALEQWYGSREKENYYTKQIMKMKE